MNDKGIQQARLFDGEPAAPKFYQGAVPRLNRLAMWGRVGRHAPVSDDERTLWFAYLANRLAQHGLVLASSMNVFVVTSALGELGPDDKQVLVDLLSEQPLVSSFEIGEPVPLVSLATGVVPVGIKPAERLTQLDALVFQALVLRLCETTISLTPGRPDSHHAAFLDLMNHQGE